MFRVVLTPLAIITVVMAGAWYFAGVHGAISAGLGGVSCFLPSLLFTLYLRHVSLQRGSFVLGKLLMSEILKVGLTIGALYLIVKLYIEVEWITLLVGMAFGLGLALQASIIAIRKKN
jgi:ATP synthase protein I